LQCNYSILNINNLFLNKKYIFSFKKKNIFFI